MKDFWINLSEILDKKIDSFPQNELNSIRKEIYQSCANAGKDKCGVYSLASPTGSGKTLSSLRFAVGQAIQNNLDRIIFVIPFLNIIEQNAREVKNLLTENGINANCVLESHSNVVNDRTDKNDKGIDLDNDEIISKYYNNWDEPIVFTTMVQFLENVYGGGTNSIRRFHNMANAVLIFDEIQSLPNKCVYMFNLLIRFLLDFTHSSVLLCSATQPPLDNLKEKAMCLPIAKSILNKKYNIFQRTEIINKVDIQKGTSYNEVAQQALDLVKAEGNCLVIVNTKASVTKLYELLKNAGTKIYCLTTNLCAEHRLKIINEIKEKLKIKEEIICISTNLIEAGVDIDFASEIRFLAGLDNVIQSAGRCNREGKLVDKDGNKKLGKVYLIFNTEEKRDWVQGLKESQQFLIDLMHDEDVDFFSEKVINDFYFNKFFLNSFQLYYSVKNVEIPETNQIDLLGDNIKFFSNSKNKDKIYPLRSSFDTSSKNFKVIDNDQIGIIVPYGKQGKEIIDKIRMGHFEFIKKAQRYTVNLYINKFKSLSTAIEDLGHGILALKEGFYDEHLGVVAEFVNQNSIY